MTIAIPADRATEIAVLIGQLLELMADHTSGVRLPTQQIKWSRKPDRVTLEQFCHEFDVAPSTFYDWRAKGKAPKYIKLPNGRIVIRWAEIERWLESLEVA